VTVRGITIPSIIINHSRGLMMSTKDRGLALFLLLRAIKPSLSLTTHGLALKDMSTHHIFFFMPTTVTGRMTRITIKCSFLTPLGQAIFTALADHPWLFMAVAI
jgi:hypothetical protein